MPVGGKQDYGLKVDRGSFQSGNEEELIEAEIECRTV
jgi:hypothetical protein